ncbi:MAG: hypothetical protein IPM33_00775 [Phycisphaerales bacterium]|nr:hypothetical protein [Phycisphaerales bacterium]
MKTRIGIAVTGLVLSCAAGSALGTNYTINWMSLAPTPIGNPPPFVGNYSLPGVGPVTMSYTAHSDFLEARQQYGPFQNGSVVNGPDTYAWANHEGLARTNWGFSGAVNSSWSVTFTFSGTVPAGQLALTVFGLGRRNPLPGETVADAMTLATVNQNGTFLGDFNPTAVGPTDYIPGAGIFQMRNSLTGPGGQDPWWNTGMGVVRIDDAVSSLTVHFDHTSGDGVGVSLGSIVPTPGTLALLSLAGLGACRRRR